MQQPMSYFAGCGTSTAAAYSNSACRSSALCTKYCSNRKLKVNIVFRKITVLNGFSGKLRQQHSTSRVNTGVCEQQHLQSAATLTGLLGLPGVTTPAAYSLHWSQRGRPRLDALWSSIIRSSNAERVLLCLDDLMMHLRSSRSLAVHIQQQHQEVAWKAAAAQVADGCQKYETYIYTSKTLANKLTAIHKHLQHAATQNNTQHQEQERYTLPLHQLLQLCKVLLACVTDQLPQDSLSWLAAQELPDPNAVQLRQLREQEKDLIAAIDAAVARPVLIELPASLSKLLNSDQPQQNVVQPAPKQSATAAAAATAENAQTQTTDTESTVNSAGTIPSHASDQVGGELLYVTRSLLAQLLQRCSYSSVRKWVYLSVLQPKLAEATSLLDKLARCRQHQALLMGHSSYSELVNQRLSYVNLWGAVDHQQTGSCLETPVDANHSSTDSSNHNKVDYLLQLVSMFHELAEDEVDCIIQHNPRRMQGEDELQSAGDKSLHRQQEEQQQHHRHLSACDDHHQQQQEPRGPWDWDYLLHQTQHNYLAALRGTEYTQHMHVSGVLSGFSRLLQELLGVELRVRSAGTAEVWGDYVIVLMVMRCQQPTTCSAQRQLSTLCCESDDPDSTPGLLGTVYLDIGGNYGCRMLRYTRTAQHTADAESTRDDLQHQMIATPAVAVGLSGKRPHVPGRSQQQQHQQQSVQYPWQTSQELDVDAEIPGQAASSSCSQSNGVVQQTYAAPAHVLSLPQLWEFGHEMGHALHLILSSRQAACHLSGRFLPPSLLELIPHIMEHLFTCPQLLSQLCCHHQSLEHLPAELAAAMAAYYGCRYNSAVALSARAAAALAEQMYCEFGGDGGDNWREGWMKFAGLPGPVAQHGSLRELSLLPVMAAHQGTYHCYLEAWCMGAVVCRQLFLPLLMKQGSLAELEDLQKKASRVFEDLHAGTTSSELEQLGIGKHKSSHLAELHPSFISDTLRNCLKSRLR